MAKFLISPLMGTLKNVKEDDASFAHDLLVGVSGAAPGDLLTEIRTFLRAGVDGVFTDNPDIGVQAVDQPSPK